MSAVADDLRALAAWADHTSWWLENEVRHPTNDGANPAIRTLVLDAATLDDFLAGFRRLPVLMEDIAGQLERRPTLMMIARRSEHLR